MTLWLTFITTYTSLSNWLHKVKLLKSVAKMYLPYTCPPYILVCNHNLKWVFFPEMDPYCSSDINSNKRTQKEA